MTMGKHDTESEGAKARDHTHEHHHRWQPHRDWRVWLAVLLMLAMILVYVMTMDLSMRPGQPQTQEVPALAP
jgi:ABC-type Zn2+ transport system substrate-binding protein/surface adhesin